MAARKPAAAAIPLRPPLEPMRATAVDDLPRGSAWRYEAKWDGWRGLAFHLGNRVYLQSRSLKPLGSYFPDITRAVKNAVPPGTVLDGELVVWAGTRTSFARLQRRVTAGRALLRQVREHPAHYVVFDLLAADGRSFLDEPFTDRREQLVDLLEGVSPQIVVCPHTDDRRLVDEWLTTWTAAGVEGVVAKKADSRYLPGGTGWRKLRARTTTEAVAGGVTGGLTAPETVLLGRYDQNGRLRYVGRSHPLSPIQRRELGALLVPVPLGRSYAAGHPWPKPLPAGWSGQFGPVEPLRYTQVQPSLVVEISADAAFEHGRWRHGVRYVRARLDLAAEDVPLHDWDEP